MSIEQHRMIVLMKKCGMTCLLEKMCLTTNIVNNVNLLTMMSFANTNARIKKHNNQPNLGACQSNGVE